MTVFSRSGSWRAERVSPDNQGDSARRVADTQMPCRDGLRSWGASRQSPFRYRIYEGESLRWERWTRTREPVAQSMYVDDSGWVVFVGEGDGCQLLWAVSPDGEETPSAMVVLRAFHDHPVDLPPPEFPCVYWDVDFVETGGMSFEHLCLPFFVLADGQRFFWLLLLTGQRLILSLDPFALVQEPSESVASQFLQVEADSASALLAREEPARYDLHLALPIIVRQGLVSLSGQLRRHANRLVPARTGYDGCSYVAWNRDLHLLNLTLQGLGQPPARRDIFGLLLDGEARLFPRAAVMPPLNLGMGVREVWEGFGPPDDIVPFEDPIRVRWMVRWDYWDEKVSLTWEDDSLQASMLWMHQQAPDPRLLLGRVVELVRGHSGSSRLCFV